MCNKIKGLNDFYNDMLLLLLPLECLDFCSIFSVYQWKVGLRTICIRIKSLGITCWNSRFLITIHCQRRNCKRRHCNLHFIQSVLFIKRLRLWLIVNKPLILYCGHCLELCFSKCGLCTSCSAIPWKLVRNAKTQAPQLNLTESPGYSCAQWGVRGTVLRLFIIHSIWCFPNFLYTNNNYLAALVHHSCLRLFPGDCFSRSGETSGICMFRKHIWWLFIIG